MIIRGVVAVIALVALTGCTDSGGENADPSRSPSRDSTSATVATVPDGFITHAGEGFEVSFPDDWEPTSDLGQLAFNVVGDDGDVPPLVSVEAVPTADVAAEERIEFFTAPVAGGTDSFEVVGEESFTVPTADDGYLREVTYVGAGPDGEDLEVQEYLVVVVGDVVDVHLRAAAPAEGFDDVEPTLRQIASTLIVTPETFPDASASPATST